jgi:mRNA interferase MazF
MNPRPGEVWLAELGWEVKTRPVVIVSRADPDTPRALVIYVPLTTQNRRSHYEVPIPKVRFLNQESVANVQGIGSLATVRLGRKLGVMPSALFADIKRATAWAMDLELKADAPKHESVTQPVVQSLQSNRRRDAEDLAFWLHFAARKLGQQDVVRKIIARAFDEIRDFYCPPDEDDVPDAKTGDIPDDMGYDVKQAAARFAAQWDECEREARQDDEDESGGQSDR